MSFSGFVFDMIRRNKENRDLLTLRRERMKDLQGKMYRKGTLQNPNITVEELEKIEKATREKEKAEIERLTMLTCEDLKQAVKEFLYAEKVIRGRE